MNQQSLTKSDEPWKTEPNEATWELRGIPCKMRRSPLGIWCGYVGVKKGHPWHGQDWSDLQDIDIHGGLTFSTEEPELGEGFWWVGFDCAHPGDLIPNRPTGATLAAFELGNMLGPLAGLGAKTRGGDGYKTYEQVREWTEDLARQALEAQK